MEGLGRGRRKTCHHGSEQNHPYPPIKIKHASSLHGGQRPPGKGQWLGIQVTWSPRENPMPNSYWVFLLSHLRFFFLSFYLFFFFSLHSPPCISFCSNSFFLAFAPAPPHGPPFTRSTGRGKSSLSSSRAGSPQACGPSCASAWRRG